MIKPKNVALDPASNAMHISKGRVGFEPTVLCCTADPHDGHVIYQWQGVAMVGVNWDISDFSNEWDCDKDVTEWHMNYELVCLIINRCMIDCIIKCIN